VLIVGILIGSAISGGTALAAGIMAQPKTADVVIDGDTVDLKGYFIEGNHYFQLRDLSAALKSGGKDFRILWDGRANEILIDTTSGYNPTEQLSYLTPETPLPTPSPIPKPQPQEPTMTIEEMKLEIVRLTNEERVKAGVSEVLILPELMDCAQAKAQDFFDNHYYGHTSPVYGPFDKMIKSYVPAARGCGENIAPWRTTLKEVFDGWMDSPGHQGNILEPRFTHIGIGVVKGANGGYWWVQQFVSLE
jgi:uncharacterized protein YkwD